MFDKVRLNEFGYYELKEKPSIEALEEYYSKQYYQEANGSYELCYSMEEITFSRMNSNKSII